MMIDHVADHAALLGHRHGSRDRQHHATVLVAGHLQHNLERLAKLAATESRLRHGPQQIRKGRHLPQVQTLQRAQPVPAAIVERISLHFLVIPLCFACVILATGRLANNPPHAGATPHPSNELYPAVFGPRVRFCLAESSRGGCSAYINRSPAQSPEAGTAAAFRLCFRPSDFQIGAVTQLGDRASGPGSNLNRFGGIGR